MSIKPTAYQLDMTDKQVSTLVRTLGKIDRLPPMLGQKWRLGMLEYYFAQLADLLLWQAEVAGDMPLEREALVAFLREEVARLNGISP
jgi:hypothetical protein